MTELPQPTIIRWVKSRKYEIVTAIRRGEITEREVRERYSLSCEELHSWMDLVEAYGVDGLRATRAQDYRLGAA